MKKDLHNIEDIKKMVDHFYGLVRQDDVLAPVFLEKIPGDWTPHLETMYRFWNAILFNIHEYSGNPLMKHMTLPIQQIHFERWIELFYKTVNELFDGPVAEDAKTKAMVIAHTFYRRMKISNKLSPLPPI